jgi:hypothetical protein
MTKTNINQKQEGKKIWKQQTWTRFMPTLPCREGCIGHYPCFLWETGSRVRVRKFLFFKWLEFTKETYYE